MLLKLPHGFANQQEIDEAYNPRLRAADVDMALRRYGESSEHARAVLPYRADVPYGATLPETLDIFLPRTSGAPVFLYLHSGYWRSNAARDFSCVALGPHARGFATVVVDYALCPGVTLDEIVRQVRAAAAWVIRNIVAYGGDPRRIVIGGHSAGGHLGAMLLCTRWRDDYGLPNDPFAGALLLSGLYDIAPLRYSYLQPSIQLDEGLVQRNSPVLQRRRCATPVMLTWGAMEQQTFEQQASSMHSAWRAAGNVSELTPRVDADHFTVIHGFEDPDSPLCATLQRMADGVAT